MKTLEHILNLGKKSKHVDLKKNNLPNDVGIVLGLNVGKRLGLKLGKIVVGKKLGPVVG